MFSSHLGHVFIAEPMTLHLLPFRHLRPAATLSTIKQAQRRAQQARWLSPGMELVLCFSQIKKRRRDLSLLKTCKDSPEFPTMPRLGSPIINLSHYHGSLVTLRNQHWYIAVIGCTPPLIPISFVFLPVSSSLLGSHLGERIAFPCP